MHPRRFPTVADAEIFVFADFLPDECPFETPSFRRLSQSYVIVGQIATGVHHSVTLAEQNRTSVIVPVTALGNALASLQLIPRG